VVEIERVRRPFWMHQVVEYLVGAVLLSFAFQSPTPAVPALLGGLVLVNAAIADGAAGAFSVVGRRLHRLLDLVVVGVLAFCAVQPWLDLELTGRLATLAIAVALLFVWFHTNFDEKPARRTRRGAVRTADPDAGRTADPEHERAAEPDAEQDARSEELGRRAGRIVGDGVNTIRRWRNRS